MADWLIGYSIFLFLCWGWGCYELVKAPTDRELWGEEIE